MILVTGDVVLGENFYEGRRAVADAPEELGSRTLALPGGALLTFELLQHLGAKVRFGLRENSVDELQKLPEQFCRRAVWKAVKNKAAEHGSTEHWALDRQLGFGPIKEVDPYPCHPAFGLDSGVPKILLINDENLGFRDASARHCWPKLLEAEKRPNDLEWVIVKMSKPVARGELWKRLTRPGWCDRLIVVASADQLRSEGSRVAGGLSWETTVDDIVDELDTPELRGLKQCRHLLVAMRSEGALWASQAEGEAPCYQLVFDRNRCEGEWGEEHKDSRAYGFLSAITAAIVWRLAELDEPDFVVALAAGLSTTRRLRELGHGSAEEAPAFPFQRAAEHLKSEANNPGEKAAHKYATAEVRNPSQKRGQWTILGQLSPWHAEKNQVSYEPARRVAREGPAKLPGVPCAKFGKLQTMDRQEIDSLRTLRQLMLMYRDGPEKKRPLCLGVFGAPGSGKSFGLKQIAEGVFGDKNPLEFNLSQFNTPADLAGAFHQVRDKVLAGLTPMVFWDEFDSKDLDWLASFLAPMQDGCFQQGQLTHFVGKSVFVFAGGTHTSFKEMEDKQEDQTFKNKKGPDFISRLSGYLDIPGPNKRDESDKEYPVRRALTIRTALELDEQRLEIEPVLLTALLGCDKYCNGARSLQKLVLYLKERGGMPLRRAYLPPDSILGLYVKDVKDFHELTKKFAAFRAQVTHLAPMMHQDYVNGLTPTERESKPYAKKWDKLPKNIQEDNIAAAMRVPEILDWAGFALESGVEGGVSESDLAEKLEEMATAEHGGWEEQRRIDGWTREKRNDQIRQHPLLIPYDQLKDADKEYDRRTIRKYPVYAREAALRIVKKEEKK